MRKTKTNRRTRGAATVLAALLLTIAALLTSCIKDDPPQSTVTAVPTLSPTVSEASTGSPETTDDGIVRIRFLKLSKTGITMKVGSTERLSFSAAPAGVDISGVVWRVDDPTVAEVNNGIVTALSVGKTYVRLSRDDGEVEAKCEVVVTDGDVLVIPVTDLTLSKWTMALTAGETAQLSYEVFPVNAVEKETKYKSGNQNIATVDAAGKVTAVAPGVVVLTVTSGSASDSCLLVVRQANGEMPAAAVQTVMVGPGMQKEISVSNELYKNYLGISTIKYVSTNEAVVKASAGRISGVKDGVAEVHLRNSFNETIYVFKVTVSLDLPIEGIKLNKTRAEIKVGQSVQLTATLLPEGARQKRIEWICENKEVYSVTQDGVVTGVGRGEARVTAYVKDENGKSFTKTCLIVVTD